MIHFSLNWLARELGVRRSDLERLASEVDDHYHPFWKGAGVKRRQIDNPDEFLKSVQRRIQTKLLARPPKHDWVHGCVRGRSPLSNARAHVTQSLIAHVDIKSFFPSVKPPMVYEAFTKLGIGPDPAALLTRLTTYHGYLPQGAPTSSALANLVLQELDDDLDDLAKQFGVTISRYVDDITLSGDSARHIVGHVVGLVRRYGFGVRHRKTKVVGPNAIHLVTGYSVNGPAASVPRRSRDRVRAAVHRLAEARKLGQDTGALEPSINGRLVHIERTNRGTASRLRLQI